MAKVLLFSFLWFFLMQPQLKASSIATITRLEGNVEILRNPSKKVKGQGPHIRYQGHYFQVRSAELGSEVSKLEIVKTGRASKAKIIFENGDVVNLAEGSQFRFNRIPSGKKQKSILGLLLGKMRAIVSKKDQSEEMEIRSATTVMGIRGTDFYVNNNNKAGNTELAVLRGAVAITGEKNLDQIVKNGQLAEIRMNGRSGEPTFEVLMRKVEKGDLIAINDVTHLKNRYGYGASMMALTAKPKTKLEKKLEALEKKAAEAMKIDVQRNDTQQFKKLEDSLKGQPSTTDEIDNILKEN